MKSPLLFFFFFLLTLPAAIAAQQTTCPDIHVFGARETTAPPGLGSAGPVIQLLLDQQQTGTNDSTTTTVEAIAYPAAPGARYGASVAAGVRAVAAQTAAFHRRCPGAGIVLVGYSQGAQIIDDAVCGGPDPSIPGGATASAISGAVGEALRAVVLMGDPRHADGLAFNVGNATAGGFAARPPGFACLAFEAVIRAYCDAEDPFCSNGTSMATHQGYAQEYGQDALEFVQRQLGGGGSGGTVDSSAAEVVRRMGFVLGAAVVVGVLLL
ncbi:catalytic core domain of acetyl xylan esterase [Xylariomycetidae sp. FL0641]|nr:catalytic core domain of acetyl xylan esterase [Xylariomycetidae sp. FL0641]